MKMRMLAAACAVCTFLAGGAAAAQFSRSAMEYVQDMGPGINIGNTLDVPKGDEVEWGNAKISHELIKLYKDKGFEVVRVPISWRRQFDRNDPKNIINPAFLARIKQVVDWCLAEDLITIINIHHDGGDDGWPGAWLTIDGKHEDQADAILRNLWTQIAMTFRNYDERLIFEGFNEVRKAKQYAGPSGKEKGQEDWAGKPEYFAVIDRYAKTFYDAVRATGGNNAKRYLMVPTYAAGYQDNTIKAWKSPNPADNHIIATLHCYEPGDFCIWGNRKAYDAKHTQNRLDQLFPKMKAHFTDNGIPLILGELNADIRYYDAEHLQPNEDARIRWIWHYTNEARKYGFPIILWESGGSKGMGLIDRFKIKWANEAFVDAFLGAARGTMDEAGAIELAKKAKVSLSSIYEKTDEVLRWKIASDSYARVWGQTMGFGNLNGGGVCMRYLSSDDKGNLIVNTKGQGGNMLHQQFWADQSVTARRTYKAYVVTHGDTPLAGRKLCFTLTARNGSTAFVQGFFRIPGIKDTIPFGADWGKPGCLVATPDNPVRHVEVPIPPTEAVWKAASSGGISMELKFFPGPWNSGKALDCVLSPITLK